MLIKKVTAIGEKTHHQMGIAQAKRRSKEVSIRTNKQLERGDEKHSRENLIVFLLCPLLSFYFDLSSAITSSTEQILSVKSVGKEQRVSDKVVKTEEEENSSVSLASGTVSSPAPISVHALFSSSVTVCPLL